MPTTLPAVLTRAKVTLVLGELRVALLVRSACFLGSTIDVRTGAWQDTTSHVGGGIDSYYEYLLKSWLLFGDKDFRRMWQARASRR